MNGCSNKNELRKDEIEDKKTIPSLNDEAANQTSP